MSHGEYAALSIVPCECGSTEVYWHGDPEGARTYCCDPCWELRRPQGCEECGYVHATFGGTLMCQRTREARNGVK